MIEVVESLHQTKEVMNTINNDINNQNEEDDNASSSSSSSFVMIGGPEQEQQEVLDDELYSEVDFCTSEGSNCHDESNDSSTTTSSSSFEVVVNNESNNNDSDRKKNGIAIQNEHPVVVVEKNNNIIDCGRCSVQDGSRVNDDCVVSEVNSKSNDDDTQISNNDGSDDSTTGGEEDDELLSVGTNQAVESRMWKRKEESSFPLLNSQDAGTIATDVAVLLACSVSSEDPQYDCNGSCYSLEESYESFTPFPNVSDTASSERKHVQYELYVLSTFPEQMEFFRQNLNEYRGREEELLEIVQRRDELQRGAFHPSNKLNQNNDAVPHLLDNFFQNENDQLTKYITGLGGTPVTTKRGMPDVIADDDKPTSCSIRQNSNGRIIDMSLSEEECRAKEMRKKIQRWHPYSIPLNREESKAPVRDDDDKPLLSSALLNSNRREEDISTAEHEFRAGELRHFQKLYPQSILLNREESKSTFRDEDYDDVSENVLHFAIAEKSFHGPYWRALSYAKEQHKLLLASVYDPNDLPSNRVMCDIFGDELIREMIDEQFVFWRVNRLSMFWKDFSSEIGVYDYPHLSVIDPTSNDVVWMQRQWVLTNPWRPQEIAQRLSELCYDRQSHGVHLLES